LWIGRSRIIGIKGLTSTMLSVKEREEAMVEGEIGTK
jgi:hypothetical protein